MRQVKARLLKYNEQKSDDSDSSSVEKPGVGSSFVKPPAPPGPPSSDVKPPIMTQIPSAAPTPGVVVKKAKR